MQINLLDIPAISPITNRGDFEIINLYPYLVHALDIYFLCSKTETLTWLMTPSTLLDPVSGITNSIPKLSVSVDGILYPIKPGLPGESPSNPITFERPVYDIKLVKNNTVGYLGSRINGSVEDQDERDSDLTGINIGTSNFTDKYIPFTVIVNDPSITQGQIYPFGGASASGADQVIYDGYGGSVVSNGVTTQIEGFGGVKQNKYLADITIVIEKSRFLDDLNNRDVGIGVKNYGIRY